LGTLIRSTNLWGYPDLVRQLGGDPAPLLKRFHIKAGVENEDDTFIPYEATARLIEASAIELECPDFGLRLSRWQGLDILGPVAVIARNAQTMLGAWEAIARYLYVHSPALELSVGLPREGRGVIQLTYTITESGLPYLPQSYELSLANGARIVRLLGGPLARPNAISFTHEQLGSADAYLEALGCQARFGQSWSGLELPAALAGRRIDTADPETQRIATKYLESQYVPSSAPLSERVSELIRRLLPTGQCSAGAIADQLAMHARTLQRRLADEGTGCHELIERERRELAGRYLAQPGMQLAQIAGLLGYAEQSTFNRSFQRWYDTTPRQYRAAATSADAD